MTTSSSNIGRGQSTVAIHAGRKRPYPYHSLTMPIVQTSTFTFENTLDLLAFQAARAKGIRDRTEYARYGNPTIHSCEAKLAALEHAEDALLFGSGMAAITSTLLCLLSAGDHIVIGSDCYRRTRQFCLNYLKRWGIEATVVPMGDYVALEESLRPNTRLIISESPTNPYLRVVDLERLVAVARQHGQVFTLIDTTFATPINQTPLDFGVDLVIHSATKYMGGHNDLLAGVVAGRAELIDPLRQGLGVLGGVLDPHTAALLSRGLRTLALRLERHNANGQQVAEFLERQPTVRRVWYPGLPSHPDHAVARAQMRGFGGVVSFEVAGSLEDTGRFLDALTIPLIAPSLGGAESLVDQPARTAYYELTSAERQAIGIKDNLVRLALGLEDAADLITDLEQALRVLKK